MSGGTAITPPFRQGAPLLPRGEHHGHDGLVLLARPAVLARAVNLRAAPPPPCGGPVCMQAGVGCGVQIGLGGGASGGGADR